MVNIPTTVEQQKDKILQSLRINFKEGQTLTLGNKVFTNDALTRNAIARGEFNNTIRGLVLEDIALQRKTNISIALVRGEIIPQRGQTFQEIVAQAKKGTIKTPVFGKAPLPTKKVRKLTAQERILAVKGQFIPRGEGVDIIKNGEIIQTITSKELARLRQQKNIISKRKFTVSEKALIVKGQFIPRGEGIEIIEKGQTLTPNLFEKIINFVDELTKKGKKKIVDSVVKHNAKIINKVSVFLGGKPRTRIDLRQTLTVALDRRLLEVKSFDPTNKKAILTLTLGDKFLRKEEKALITILEPIKLKIEFSIFNFALKGSGFVFKKIFGKPAGVVIKWTAKTKAVKISKRSLKRVDNAVFKLVNGKSIKAFRKELRLSLPKTSPIDLIVKGKKLKIRGKEFVEVKTLKGDLLTYEAVARKGDGVVKQKLATIDFKNTQTLVRFNRNGKIKETIIGYQSGKRFVPFGAGVKDDVMSVFGGRTKFTSRAEQQIAEKKLVDKFFGIGSSKKIVEKGSVRRITPIVKKRPIRFLKEGLAEEKKVIGTKIQELFTIEVKNTFTTEANLVKHIKLNKFTKAQRKIFNKFKRTKAFKLFEKKHKLRSLKKVSKGLLPSEAKALKVFEDKLKKVNIKADLRIKELAKLLSKKRLTNKQSIRVNTLINDLAELRIAKKDNLSGIKILRKVGKTNKLSALNRKIRAKLKQFRIKRKIKIKEIPKITTVKKELEIRVTQINLLKPDIPKSATTGVPKRFLKKDSIETITRRGVERGRIAAKERKIKESIRKAKDLANSKQFGVTTKTGVKVKPRTITESETKALSDGLIQAGVFETQAVYNTAFRTYSLAYPLGSRVGFQQAFSLSQKAGGRLSVVLSSQVIQRQIEKQLVKPKLEIESKLDIKPRVKLDLKPKLITKQKRILVTKPKLKVKPKIKLKIKPKVKLDIKPDIKPDIRPIIFTFIRTIVPTVPKFPPLIGGKKKGKGKGKVKKKVVSKRKKAVKKPTFSIGKQILEGKPVIKPEKEVKKRGKKKKKNKKKKLRNPKKRKSNKNIRKKRKRS